MAKKKTHKKMGSAKKQAQKAAGAKRPKGATAADRALLEDVDTSSAAGSSWRAKEFGDTVLGDVLSIVCEPSSFPPYAPQAVLTLGTDEGGQTVYANSSMIRGLFEQGVNVGDRIAIQYKDDLKTGKGNPLKLYAVKRSGGPGEVSEAIREAYESARKGRRKGKKAPDKKKGKKGKKTRK